MTKGERIKARRESLGLSQTDVAKQLGVTKQTIYKYEKDIITNIPSDVLEDLSRVLNCPPSYIMGWDELKLESVNVGNNELLFFGENFTPTIDYGNVKVTPPPLPAFSQSEQLKRLFAYINKILSLSPEKQKQIQDYIDFIIEKE